MNKTAQNKTKIKNITLHKIKRPDIIQALKGFPIRICFKEGHY